ncbi:MAG: alpha-L-rhamnosidase, partial [Solimonas sp.]
MPIRLSRRRFLASSGTLLLAPHVPAMAAPAPPLAVVGLRTEQLVDPLGLETTAPQLSWRLQANRRGVRQRAYRVQVAESAEALAAGRLLWDSGRVDADTSTGVRYGGAALRSRQRCCWQVRIWDDAGREALSPPACWEMGLLDA